MWLLALVLALSLFGCSGSTPPDAGSPDAASVDSGMLDAGPRACRNRRSCGELVCVRDSVAEISFEPGEEGLCRPADEAIGFDAPRWDFRPGGPTLASRLCTAQGLGPGAGTTDRRRELLREAGIAVVRPDFAWQRIEPERGVFDFSAYDVMVDAADADGLEVIGILAYGNPWASAATTDDAKYPPDDPADFARWAGAMAAHYAGRIQRWEVWNEQNAGYRFWKPTIHGDASAYATLLTASAHAIHTACTDCQVVSGGLFFHEQLINGAVEFTHDMLDADAHVFDEVDAFGFHPYPLYAPAAPPEQDGEGERSIGAMVSDLHAVLALHHAPELPMAATELGWPVYGVVDEAMQARFLSRAMILGTALGVDPLCWFNVTDGPDHGMFPPEDDFGLYRYPSEDPASPIDPKPARDAMHWLSVVGRGAVFVSVVDDPSLHAPDDGRFGLDFERPEGCLRVLFSLASHEVSLPDEVRAAYDHLGHAVTPTGTTFTIGPSPLFFVPPGI